MPRSESIEAFQNACKRDCVSPQKNTAESPAQLAKDKSSPSRDLPSQVVLVVKNPPANAGDSRGLGSTPESGRSPGEGLGNPFQYSCLGNPMDRGAWWAEVHEVTKSQTQLSN